MSRALVIACALAAVAAAAGADTVTVGGKELQSLYPFRCC
jgi:hypothetical protein